ncbi:ABC transporter permease [Halobacterium salinarum]|uniref:ABC transporter permease n=1 Tax=Halobacterium salinarum TaxID=2242 RepID=UPI001F3D754D|nr:ABC transporter permease [Halobacterium salinarum]MCF2207174.1 ABC transporter permease [Halobacterium salinarum]MCF2241058.1 ABC transporter permease [Halobacterium salinarum]
MNRPLYIAKRLLLGVPVLLFGLTLTFLILYLGPIDPVLAILGKDATPTAARNLEISLGIRYPNGSLVPLWVQYKNFLVNMVTFDFGTSWAIARNQPVAAMIVSRLPATIWLGFWSVLVALFVGIPVGLYAGLNSNSWSDYAASFGGIVWRAMPNFWLAVMLSGLITAGGVLSGYRDLIIETDVVGTSNALQHLFSGIDPFAGVPVLEFFWIPVPNLGPMAEAFKWILPAALVLGSSSMGNEVRIGRTAVLESLRSEYVDTAKAKGVSPRRIIVKHIGRNAVIPLLPVIMGEFYLLIGGSVLVEKVFSINGIGNLFIRAAFNSDIPVMMSLVFIFILMQILFNLLQDVLYTYIDPRITLSDTTE